MRPKEEQEIKLFFPGSRVTGIVWRLTNFSYYAKTIWDFCAALRIADKFINGIKKRKAENNFIPWIQRSDYASFLQERSKKEKTNGGDLSLCRAAYRAHSRPSRTGPVLCTASLSAAQSFRVWIRLVHCRRFVRHAILSLLRVWRLILDPIRNPSSRIGVLKEQTKPPPRRLTAVYLDCHCAYPELF